MRDIFFQNSSRKNEKEAVYRNNAHGKLKSTWNSRGACSRGSCFATGTRAENPGVALLANPVTTPDPLSRWLAADPDPVAVAVSSYGYGLGKTSLEFSCFPHPPAIDVLCVPITVSQGRVIFRQFMFLPLDSARCQSL